MTNTKQCQSCVYGEFWARVGWVCKRAFDAQKDIVYQDRISNRTENKCFDYEKRGKRKMNAIIVDKDKKEEVKAVEKTVEKPVESVEKSDDKPKKHSWTTGDTETLIHFYNKGAELKDLAEMFEVTETAIKLKLQKLKRSEQWKGHFTDSTTTSKTETLPEPETVTAEVKEISPITAHIKDLKAYFADFVIEKCKREVVPDAVEFIGAYIKYLEEKVNE